jgi:hypothetical protein
MSNHCLKVVVVFRKVIRPHVVIFGSSQPYGRRVRCESTYDPCIPVRSITTVQSKNIYLRYLFSYRHIYIQVYIYKLLRLAVDHKLLHCF